MGKFRTGIPAKERSDLRKAMRYNKTIKEEMMAVLALTDKPPPQGWDGTAKELFTTAEQAVINAKLKLIKNLIVRPLTGAVINIGEDSDFNKMLGSEYKGWLNYGVPELRAIWQNVLRTQASHTMKTIMMRLQPNSSITVEPQAWGMGIPRMVPTKGAKWKQYNPDEEYTYASPGPTLGAPKFVKDLDRVVLQIGTDDPAQVLRAARTAQEFGTRTGWVSTEHVEKGRPAIIDEQTGEEVDDETLQTMLRTIRDALGDKIAEYPEEMPPKVRQTTGEHLQADRRLLADWRENQKIRAGLIQEFGTVEGKIDRKDRKGIEKFFAGAPAVKKSKAIASRRAAEETQSKRAGMKTKTEVAKKKAAKTAKLERTARKWREFEAKKKARKKAGTYYKKKKPAPADPEEGRE
jgi:hypothetical protein